MTCSVCPEHTYFFGTKTHCTEPTGLGINYLAHRAGGVILPGFAKGANPPLPPVQKKPARIWCKNRKSHARSVSGTSDQRQIVLSRLHYILQWINYHLTFNFP